MPGTSLLADDNGQAQLAQLRHEIEVLRATIEIVRHSPALSDGGPIADMLDEALAGKTPRLVKALAQQLPLTAYAARSTQLKDASSGGSARNAAFLA